MAAAVCQLEENAKLIHKEFRRLSTRSRSRRGVSYLPTPKAYASFREDAFSLLSHYVRVPRHEAFKWLLMMNKAAPRKVRISLSENPFHWGLLAIEAATGTFMSPNKLRDLGVLMNLAYGEGVEAKAFEQFIRDQRALRRFQAQQVIASLSAPSKKHARERRKSISRRAAVSKTARWQ